MANICREYSRFLGHEIWYHFVELWTLDRREMLCSKLLSSLSLVILTLQAWNGSVDCMFCNVLAYNVAKTKAQNEIYHPAAFSLHHIEDHSFAQTALKIPPCNSLSSQKVKFRPTAGCTGTDCCGKRQIKRGKVREKKQEITDPGDPGERSQSRLCSSENSSEFHNGNGNNAWLKSLFCFNSSDCV